MRRMRWMLCAGALVLSSIAFAADPADEPLDPEKAFQPSVRLAAGTSIDASGMPRHGIDIDYRIADGYYLYRDRLRFEVVPAGLAIGPAEFPQARDMDDPFVGRTSIYREKVTIHLPFAVSVVPAGIYRLRITAQGCAENRFCYSPFRQELALTIAPGYRSAGTSPVPATPSRTPAR